MRRPLTGLIAVLATATALLGLNAGAALADGLTTVAPSVSLAPTATTTTTAATTTAPTTTAPKPTKPPKPIKAKPTKPKPTARAKAVKGSAKIYLYDAFYLHGQTLITPQRPMHVTGIVRPYVPGQRVSLTAFLGKQRISNQTLTVRPLAGQNAGKVVAVVTAPAPGVLHLQLSHKRTARMMGFAGTRGVASLNTHVGFGSTGSFVQLLQAKLEALHFYIPQSGVYDEQTELAVDAYHRLMHQGVSQDLDGLATSEILDGRGAFPVRYPGDGQHVEGNLGLQLLAEINGDKVYAIYPISSGKPSTPTILGRFRVYERTPGYLSDGMYYSDFFYGGYAIHGYDPAPDYPASHGCMRVPITDAISIWNWLSIGVGVDVYQ